MALPPHLADLEGRLASRLDEALAGFRRAVEERLRAATERLLADATDLAPPSVAQLFEAFDAEALDAAPRRDGARAAAAALLEAARAFDRATTQAEVLEALVVAARANAERAALLLVRDGRLVEFASAGFDAPPARGREHAFDGALRAALDAGTGCRALDGDRARAASALLGWAPLGPALVVPLVLRDKVAALVWTDRGGEAPEAAPLQLLVHLAAQRLELQPLSARAATPTLFAAGDAEALPLWSAPAEAAVAELAAAAVAAVPVEAAPPVEPAVAAEIAAEGVVEEVEEITPIEVAAPALEQPGLAAAPEPEPAVEEAWEPATRFEVAPAIEEAERAAAEAEWAEAAPAERATAEFEAVAPAAAEEAPEAVAAMFELESVAPPLAPEAPPSFAEPEAVSAEALGTLEMEAIAIEGEPEAAFEPVEEFEQSAEFEEVAALEAAPEAEIAAAFEPEAVAEAAPEFVAELEPVPDLEVAPELEPEPVAGAAAAPPAPPPAPPEPEIDLLSTVRLQRPALDFLRPPEPAPTPPPRAEIAARSAGVVTHEFPAPSPAPPPAVPLERDSSEDATLLTRRYPVMPALPEETAAPRAPAPPLPPAPPAPSFAPPPVAAVTAPFVPPVVPAPPVPPIAPVAPVAPPAAPKPVDDAMDRTASRMRTTEVAPPADVQGPGRAFAGFRPQRAAADSPTHEEAKRLARLLISEIKLYNEEQVLEGRRNRDLYHRLKEDIDRSRQIYEERVDPAVRAGSDYFHQELVRSLAGGDPRALGI